MRIPRSAAAVQHFIFGYGSLISSNSRAITVPEHSQTVVTPVLVQGLERVWSKRTGIGMTAVGVQFTAKVSDSECVGVLLPVSDFDLQKFDQREEGYDRVLLDLEQVQPVPFLDIEEHYSDPDHEIYLEAKQEMQQKQIRTVHQHPKSSGMTNNKGRNEEMNPKVNIWVYVPRKRMMPTVDHPIVQTYVDTILRGCLEISEEFAAQFLSTTTGWHPDEEVHEDSVVSVGDVIPDQVPLINDRKNPIYRRGDPKWSLQQAETLDRLIFRHRPDLLQQRKSNKNKLKTKTRSQQNKSDYPTIFVDQ